MIDAKDHVIGKGIKNKVFTVGCCALLCRGQNDIGAPWYVTATLPVWRRLCASTWPNSVPRGQLPDDLLVIESLEQLQKVIDPACLPPDLSGTGLAYDDGAFASMLHIDSC